MHQNFGRASVFAFLIGLAGCAPQNAPPPPTAPVKGVVHLDGKPMSQGQVRFSVLGFPPKVIEINDGTFSGEAYAGENKVEVVLLKEGPPDSTDPNIKTMINQVDPKYSGAETLLKATIPREGASDLKFEVTSAAR
jgi:hypothetical protein